MANVYLLTGSTGTGKTTIVKEALRRTKAKAGGFYTEEIRISGTRQGFKIVTLDGHEAILAHIDTSSPCHVSKYGVDIHNLDNIGVNAVFKAIRESTLIIIDEIGKMELFSACFKEAVLKAIDSGKKVLATIMLNSHPFADGIKRHPRVTLIQVNRVNNEMVLQEIIKWIKTTADENNS
jgi:nucleoside-triphosphatase